MCKLSALERFISQDDLNVESVESIRWAINSEKSSVFAHIIALKTLAKKDALATTEILPLIIPSSDPHDFSVDGTRFSSEILRNCVRLLLDKVKHLLDKLLLGVECPEVSQPFDRLRNSSPGFGLRFHENERVCRDIGLLVLNRIQENPALAEKYLERVDENGPFFKIDAGMKYLDLHQQFIRLLLTLIHLTYGMPARASELERLALRNSGGSLRNVYFSTGKLFILCFYNKTSSLSGQSKPIARFLPKELSDVVLVDLFVLRPFLALMAESLGKNGHHYLDYMFPTINGPFNAGQIRDVFAAEMLRNSGCPIIFSQYRHVVKYLSNLLMLDSIEEQVLEETDARDMQTGHSRNVSQFRYGLSSTEHSLIRDSALNLFAIWSEKWQKFLEISQTNRLAADGILENPVFELINRRNNIFHVESTPLKAQEIFIGKREKEAALFTLKDFYGEAASFKSKDQLMACAYTLFSEANVFVIMPTSSGKSLVFFLYSFLMKKKNSGRVSIVIAPTVSLKLDLVNRGNAHGLWICNGIPDSSEVYPDLIILTPESCLTVAVRKYLCNLVFSGRLARIFIDECHLFSCEGDFRPSFRELVSLKFLSVPFVFLTATCPFWIQEDIITSFIGDGNCVKVIRSPTVRKNISIRFEEIPNAEFFSASAIHKIKSSFDTETFADERSRMIVFCPDKRMVEDLCDRLMALGVPSTIYHSALEKIFKEDSDQKWRRGIAKVMVATSAYGIGIDYGHVRSVFLVQLPFTIEEFQQEIGRAGRDGLLSEAIILFNPAMEMSKPYSIKHSEMLKLATRKGVCRVQQLSQYMDQKEYECSEFQGVACDACSGFFPRTSEPSLYVYRQVPTFNSADSIRALFVEMKDLVERLRSFCPAHLLEKKVFEEHSQLQCQLLRGKCLSCWSPDHRTSNHFGPKQQLVFSEISFHVCARCYFPSSDSGASFHSEAGVCKYSDWLKTFAMGLSLRRNNTDLRSIYGVENGIPSIYLLIIRLFQNIFNYM